ncbi:MAG TPA: 16S rRNA (cytosine(967)-C(5))-methyltransferase RsmB [Chthoniobacterales bacterium]|nr:16S rRNA (cytosine(967)-C(5))-methyltransferase RsmB [Chthoniobacterales bacterium]
MAGSSARRVALTALRVWRTKKRFADSIISGSFAETKLAAQDRAFALELFYGVLRNLTLLDFWILRLRPSKVDVDLCDILRLGLYQLFILEISEHAAVYETVELAQKRNRALINGVLRAAARRREELREQAKAQPLDVRTSHPKFLLTRWETNFGSEAAQALCDWNNHPPPIYARINRLRIDPDSFWQTYPNSRPVPNNPNFVEVNLLPADALESGHCYIQDPSTALACELLDPKPGEKILDACAAPGGKTSYLAELMKNRGAIIACDRDPGRIDMLEKNLARLGVEIARVFRHDWIRGRIPEKMAAAIPVDRILIDAPCSNTGVMRRRVDVRWRLTPADFRRMQKRQIGIVRTVVSLLKPGGVLVYSTCSLEPEENEEVVQQILANLSMLQRKEEKRSLPFRDHFDGAFATKFIKAA